MISKLTWDGYNLCQWSVGPTVVIQCAAPGVLKGLNRIWVPYGNLFRTTRGGQGGAVGGQEPKIFQGIKHLSHAPWTVSHQIRDPLCKPYIHHLTSFTHHIKQTKNAYFRMCCVSSSRLLKCTEVQLEMDYIYINLFSKWHNLS